MFGDRVAYLDTSNDTYFEWLGPGKIGKQLEAESEFPVDLKSRTPGAIRKIGGDIGRAGTMQLNKKSLTAVEDPAKQQRYVVDQIEKISKEIGETFDGTTEGWEAMQPQSREIITNSVIDGVFNAKNLTTEQKVQYAFRLANVTGSDISEKVTERFIEDTITPTILSRIKKVLSYTWAGRHIAEVHGVPEAEYSPAETSSVTDEATKIVTQALISEGPNTIRGFLGDASGNITDIYSDEVQQRIFVKAREAVDRYINDREAEPGIIGAGIDILTTPTTQPGGYTPSKPLPDKRIMGIGGKGRLTREDVFMRY